MSSNGPKQTSYSALSDWIQCGKKYELKRVVKAPKVPSYSLIGGSAVHAVCDRYDLNEDGQDSDTFDFTGVFIDVFQELLDKEERKSGVPSNHWNAPGRKTKEWPNGRNLDWWTTEGPKMARSYALWREANPAYALWFTPSGSPAVEVNVRATIGGVPVVMKIDRVFVVDGRLVVVDLKTGSRSPAWLLQLGVYALGVEHQFGLRPDFGTFFLAEKGTIKVPVSLGQYTESYLSAMLDQFQHAVGSNIFVPNVTDMCVSCEVRHACYAVGGKLSHMYDGLHPSNIEGSGSVE